MDSAAQVKKNLKAILGNNTSYPIRGTVTATDGETCSVKLASGLTVSKVRLKVVVNGADDYLMVTPPVGSDVMLISGNGTLDDLTILKCDAAESIKISNGGLIVLVDGTDGKVQVKNDDASLVDVLSDLATLLKQIKVYTPSGPSGTPLPDTITAITQFETKFKKLLK